MLKSIVFIFTVLLVVQVNAQTDVISYNEAVKIALDQNLLIKSEANNMDIFKADRLQTIGQYLPTANVFAVGDQTSGRQFDLTSGQLVTQTSQRLSMGLNVNLLIFNGFQRINSLKQAQYNVQAHQSFQERVRQQITFQTTQQYLQILIDNELLKIAEQNVKEQQALRERLKEFSEVGNVPITDFYTQDAEVKRLEMLLLQAQNNLLADKALFSQTLQLDPARDFVLEEPEWMENQLYENLNLDRLYQQALENRADFKQQNFLVSSQMLGVRSARARLYPQLGAFYNYGSGYSSVYQRQDPETKVYGIVPLNEQLFTDNVFSSIGLSLNIPILSNLTTRSQIMRSKTGMENQDLAVEDSKRTIFTEVQAAYLDYNAIRQRYEAAVVSKNAADLAFEAQKERFSVGLSNLLEYNAANTIAVRGQSELVQARYALLFQHVIMDFFTGTLQVANF